MDGEFQREAKKAGLFDVPVSSCEAELQELMRQIDIMVHNRKVEWEADLEGVKRRLQLRDQEVVSQRAALEAKHLEVGRLRHQLDSSEGDKTLLSSQYEQKLTQLRTQLTSLQLDYEKMERHHSKHTVGAEREKNQADVQLQDAQGQLKTAQAKILELQKVASEWAVQKRAFQQQVESLETQRKILADKCQLVQQQSSGYQDQLRKRRHLLEQTEVNFRSQLAHLEGHLARSQDTVEDKSALAQRLEERLRELDGGRKHEEGERAELEERCRAAEGRLRHMEDEKARLISELQSRDELITQGDRAMKQHRQEIAKMDESIALKDDMMRSLREESGQEARLQVHELQGQLDFEGRENARLRRIETQLQQDVERLQARLDESHLECAHLNTELASKIDELRHLEGTEMQQLQDQLAKAVAKHNEQEQRYQSHFDGMQSEVAALTSDLHYRDNTIATLSHNLASLERKEREEVQRAERYQHELQVILLNRNLRTTSNILVGNLAVADIMMFTFSVPMSTVMWLFVSWPDGALGSLLCKLGGAAWALSQVMCATSLTAVSIERYLSLRRRVQMKRTVAILAVIWLVGLCFTAPMLFFGHTFYLPDFDMRFCRLMPASFAGVRAYATSYAVLTYYLPVFIIICCYVGMAKVLTCRAGGESLESLRARRRLAVVVLFLAIAFTIFWFPYHFINMFFIHTDQETLNSINFEVYERLIEIAHMLIYVNSCLNPFVVFFISQVHRKPLVDFLRCRCRKKPAPSGVDGRYAPVPEGVYAETTMSMSEYPQ